uniref:hypothetical protein n=1 Tax=Streptomyces sp. NPDC096176 TaxID=3366079 RepID=UPI0037FF5128
MKEQGLTLADATQHEVDAWLAGSPSTRYEVRDFVVWAARRGHSGPLLVPHRPKADPVGIDDDSHWELLQQCLTERPHARPPRRYRPAVAPTRRH